LLPYTTLFRSSERSPRSNVTSLRPATTANATRYASAHTFGDELRSAENRRNSGSMASGSASSAIRSSAHTLSHRAHASDIVLTSFPITIGVVKSRRTVICVIRQKKNSSSLERSNHARAFSDWMWPLQKSASHTLASRKFNTFIDLVVRHKHLRSIRD